MFEIPAAFNQPTAFAGKESVRIGSYRQDLRRYPGTEKQLWYALNRVSYEQTTSSEQNLHFKDMTLIAKKSLQRCGCWTAMASSTTLPCC